MKLNKSFVKSNIADLRHKMIKSKHWSIFVGDKAYKTNFFLRFKSISSKLRFRKDFTTLHSFGVKILVGWAIVFVLINLLTNIMSIPWKESGVLLVASLFSYYSLHKKLNWVLGRAIIQATAFLFITSIDNANVNVKIIDLLGLKVSNELHDHLLIMTIIFFNFTIDVMFTIEWFKHFPMLGLQIYLFVDYNQTGWLLIPELLVYSLIEMIMKMHWVFKDTSK